MSTRIWFPVCTECEKITKFIGPDDLGSDDVKCQICDRICEDGHQMQKEGRLTLEITEEAKRKFVEATDTLFRHPDGSWY